MNNLLKLKLLCLWVVLGLLATVMAFRPSIMPSSIIGMSSRWSTCSSGHRAVTGRSNTYIAQGAADSSRDSSRDTSIDGDAITSLYSYPQMARTEMTRSVAHSVGAAAMMVAPLGLLLHLSTNSADAQEIEDAIMASKIVNEGFINLNSSEPIVTDVCWLDISLGNNTDLQRLEVSLYGNECPAAVSNFKSLCLNEEKGENGRYGYAGSSIFRVISQFSVQGGNIGQPDGTPPSQLSRYGKAGNPYPQRVGSSSSSGMSFSPDNFRILHSYREAGVVSMMRDIGRKGLLDSRFFITTSPYASWADGKYEAFGRVTRGMNIVSAMQIIPVTPPSNCPQSPIRIMASGCYRR